MQLPFRLPWVTVPLGELVCDRATGKIYRGDGTTVGGVMLLDMAGVPDTVATPAFDPDGHEGFEGNMNVAITCATPGAEIRYTKGTELPSQDNGLAYRGPFNIQSTVVLWAVAYKPGMRTSAISRAIFVKDGDSEPGAPDVPTLPAAPALDDVNLAGGHMVVPDLETRDAIPASWRKLGLTVYVDDPGQEYRLVEGITNDDWVAKSEESGAPGAFMTGTVEPEGVVSASVPYAVYRLVEAGTGSVTAEYVYLGTVPGNTGWQQY